MKKPIIFVLIFVVLFLMPTLGALPIETLRFTTQKNLPLLEYDGTFIGGYGIIYKENEERQLDYHGYLGGVYKNNDRYTVLYGNIYNLEKEQVGNISLLTARFIVIGKINIIGRGRIPVVGFLLTNENNLFIGRLMSLFGPAPHIWGKFTPN